jgi:hypothetical protein
MSLSGKLRKDRSQVVSEDSFDLFHDRIRGAAVRAFVVAVLDERQRRRRRTANVVVGADIDPQTRMLELLAHADAVTVIASRAARLPSAPGFTSTGET